MNYPKRSKRQREWHEIEKFCTDNPSHFLCKALDARQIIFELGFSSAKEITREIRVVYQGIKALKTSTISQ